LNKVPKTQPNILSQYFISVSLIGLFLLAALTFGIPTLEVNFSWRKPVIGSIFGLICFLGIMAAVYPPKCSRMLHFQRKSEGRSHYDAEQGSMGKRITTFEGHHPICGNFSAHVIQLGGKKHCAGCTGLVIGAMISLSGISMYFFTGVFLKEMATLFFWLGFAGVSLGLLQYNLFTQRSLIHLFLNVIFVLGTFFLLIGIEEITSNMVLEVYFVTLTLYWILTRILVSQREHRKICVACGLESCRFFE